MPWPTTNDLHQAQQAGAERSAPRLNDDYIDPPRCVGPGGFNTANRSTAIRSIYFRGSYIIPRFSFIGS